MANLNKEWNGKQVHKDQDSSSFKIQQATHHYLLTIKELHINAEELEEIRMILEQYTSCEYNLSQKLDFDLEPSIQKKKALSPNDLQCFKQKIGSSAINQ